MENAAQKQKVVTCDQERWVRDRIKAAMRMALALSKEERVMADQPLTLSALEGVANGAAVEIIHTLGLKTEYVNLRNPYDGR